MKKRVLSLLLCLCMAFALLPVTALAAAGESDVDITVTQGATTAKVKSSRMEVESVSWSGSTVTIKVKIKDSQPFTVFAKKAADIYVTVNKEEAKNVQRLDDKHIVVTYNFAAANTGNNYASNPGYVVLKSAHTKEELNAKWEECRPMYEGGVYTQRPSVSAPYSTGTLVDAAVVDALNYLNYARYASGLPEVKLDADLQDRAQYGAVLMAATHQLSHTPSKPSNMSQTFYQRGYASTTHSNICSKRIELRVLNDGLLYQLSDATASNLKTVGHRRWLLNPRLGKTGFGAATGSDGIIYHTTECHDTSAPAMSYEAFAWPVPGYQSVEQFNANDPFSLSLNPDVYDSTRLSEVKATVTVTGTDGRKQTFTLDHSDKNTSGEYFNIVKDQIGTGFAVIFRPMFTRAAGTKVVSEVSGLYKKDSNTPVTVRWETEFFYPEYFNFTDMEFEDVVISIEREMEDYAKSLGEVANNTVTEADLVRVALYPLRDNSQIAFVGTHDFSKTPATEDFGRITTTVDLTYHGKPISVKVSAQIMVRDDPGGEKSKALADIKEALKAAGDPGPTSATEVAKSAAAAHGITVTNCNPQHPNTGNNPAYKGLKRYEVTIKTGEKKNEKGYTTSITEKYRIVYENGKGLGVYLPLGSTEMPAVGALNQKTANIPPSEVAELPSAEPAPQPEPTPEPTPTPTPAPVSTMESGSKSLPKLSQMEIAALIKAAPDTLTAAPFEIQPSVKAPYATGKVAAAALQTAANRLTMLRRLAGLPAVELDEELNEQAQYGAVLLAASEFSHTPAQPAGMDDDFYQKGRAATPTSNLHYYASSGKTLTNSLYVLAQAPDALMDDSDSSNVARVGHRRWQLNPTLKKVGFGFSVDQSDGWTTQYVDEKIFDTSGSTSDYDFISWPASGNFPNDLEAFNKNTAWSVTLNPKLYAKPEQTALTVTLKRIDDGKTWTFSGGESTAAADSGKYFGVDNSGRGVPNCIIFRPDGVSKYEGSYTVDIAGLFTTAGEAAPLHYAVTFFDSGNPQAAPPTIPATGTAYPSTQTVDLDGKKVTFQMYALKDASGNPTNYVKVRDLALAINGTKAQFNVDWNGAVDLVAGTAYQANGSENKTPFSGSRAYTVPTNPTSVNGAASDLTAIFLVDDAGGGYTYYQLRDLGKKLGFNVDWSAEKGVFIETDKPYSSK